MSAALFAMGAINLGNRIRSQVSAARVKAYRTFSRPRHFVFLKP